MLKIFAAGVEYRLSLLFPAVLVVLLTFDQTGIAAWCVAASFMHEAGHFVAMYAFGCRPSMVNIGVFGASVQYNPGISISNRQSILVALAGPSVNVISFTVLFIITGWTVPVTVHLVLALFNLMPIEALDGGQALYYALAGFLGEEKAERIGFCVSISVLIPLATAGFYLLVSSGYNFTLLAVSLYLGLLILFKRKC